MAPWAEQSDVDMKLFTEVNLERTEKTALGLHGTAVTDHKDLFISDTHDSSIVSVNNNSLKPKGQKVLLIGKTGTGKSTLGKKLAYDWAKRYFTTFSIVFFILLKKIESRTSIETVMRNQIPDLNSLNITDENLRNILENFGDNCLIILDGFDEFQGEENDDVFQVMNTTKYYFCNILVTSRPHCTTKVEEHYKTFTIKGFTKDQAEYFAGKLLVDDENKMIQNVLRDINMDPDSVEYVDGSPILVSIMCSLVKNKRIVSSGEIVSQLMICLYQYYTRRTGIEYQFKEYLSVLKKLGPLALQMLLSQTYPGFKSSDKRSRQGRF